LAQRGGQKLEDRGRRVAKEEPVKKEPAAAAPKPSAAKKLSYKQKFALENLPKQMEEAEGKIAKLEEKMADPAFYTRDPAGFAKVAAEIDALRAGLTTME